MGMASCSMIVMVTMVTCICLATVMAAVVITVFYSDGYDNLCFSALMIVNKIALVCIVLVMVTMVKYMFS